MTLNDVMTELAAKGSATTKRTYMTHGAPEPLFGVKISDLKVILKRIRGDQALAMALYDSGNSDAMYLAGLLADGRKMSPAQLDRWAIRAPWHLHSACTVAWVASEHPDAIPLALKWIDSPKESIALTGWSTLGAVVAVVPDEKLPVKQLSALLDRVAQTLHSSPNRVRYAMNGFVIACGTYVEALGEKAIATARKLGRVEVDMAGSCKVPEAESYIIKSRRGGAVAPKRKTVKC